MQQHHKDKSWLSTVPSRAQPVERLFLVGTLLVQLVEGSESEHSCASALVPRFIRSRVRATRLALPSRRHCRIHRAVALRNRLVPLDRRSRPRHRRRCGRPRPRDRGRGRRRGRGRGRHRWRPRPPRRRRRCDRRRRRRGRGTHRRRRRRRHGLFVRAVRLHDEAQARQLDGLGDKVGRSCRTR